MIKLTAERARERIEALQRWQEQRGLTERESEYLQAMIIAEESLLLKEKLMAMTEPFAARINGVMENMPEEVKAFAAGYSAGSASFTDDVVNNYVK